VPLYAVADIPEVWIVDLRHSLILIHRDPSPEGYRDGTEYGPGATIGPLAFPDLTITHAEVFGTE
jgi:Uma2 family endonuclease